MVSKRCSIPSERWRPARAKRSRDTPPTGSSARRHLAPDATRRGAKDQEGSKQIGCQKRAAQRRDLVIADANHRQANGRTVDDALEP